MSYACIHPSQLLSLIFRVLTPFSQHTMASSEKNIALQRVLDDDDAADTAAPGILAQGEAANPEASQALYGE
jgi:hypothetical protein